MNSPSQQVARREETPVPVDISAPLKDLDQAVRLCDVLAQSRVVPRTLQGNPANILVVLMAGAELGLSWPVALRTIYVPSEGQLGIRGQLLLAKLREAGHDYEWEESGDSCTFILTRGDKKDKPYKATFTLDDAVQAGLADRRDGKVIARSREGKPMPWMQYTSRMLFWRAVADCVGRAAPEVMLGFAIQGAEAPEEPQPEVQLRPESPAPPGPAGQAATGDGQAVQAELKELDERMRLTPREVAQVEDALADPEVGGNPAGAIDPDMAEDLEAETTSEPAGPSKPETEARGNTAGPQDDDASAKAKAGLLREWFTKCSYDPTEYPGRVRHACSVYVKRRIWNMGGLRAAEVMSLSNELSALYRKEDELAPVSRLADKISDWEEAWRAEDPAGFAAYEEAVK